MAQNCCKISLESTLKCLQNPFRKSHKMPYKFLYTFPQNGFKNPLESPTKFLPWKMRIWATPRKKKRDFCFFFNLQVWKQFFEPFEKSTLYWAEDFEKIPSTGHKTLWKKQSSPPSPIQGRSMSVFFFVFAHKKPYRRSRVKVGLPNRIIKSANTFWLHSYVFQPIFIKKVREEVRLKAENQ